MTGHEFLLILFAATFACALPLTSWVRVIALRRGIIDHPSNRGSHAIPTPRGGGIAIVIAHFGALGVLLALGYITSREAVALIGGGSAVAVVGFLDDRKSMAASTRFLVHLGAATLVVVMIGGVPIPGLAERAPWVGRLLGIVGITWAINLFNFMDGIDGIAGAEAVFVSLAACAMIIVLGADVGLAGSMGSLGMASAGFLIWNWPPARIFLGDVGSGFLGFMLAALAILVSCRIAFAVQVWPILGGVFLVDATVTLIRRAARGDRWYEAHRLHAYQHLTRAWGGHRSTTLFVCAINLCWLLPWAWYALKHPPAATICMTMALLPLACGAIWAGAGRP
ncbi:MAG: MraY family glycosyltransferase [Steroidobacteraceae bacterium]